MIDISNNLLGVLLSTSHKVLIKKEHSSLEEVMPLKVGQMFKQNTTLLHADLSNNGFSRR